MLAMREREGGRHTLSIFPGLTLKMVMTSMGADMFAMSGWVSGVGVRGLGVGLGGFPSPYIHSSALEVREYFGTARSQLQ